MEKTLNWLADEVEELREALEKGNKEETEKEFADVVAWLASLANIAEVNLENAALEKYPYKCPKCLHAPCKCKF
jgi:NTP pyrophosphatase (non-canonical NTP hydrolase)